MPKEDQLNQFRVPWLKSTMPQFKQYSDGSTLAGSTSDSKLHATQQF